MKAVKTKRIERLNDLLRESLSTLFFEQNKDPRLQKITITQVEVSSDLYQARVYYRLLPVTQQKSTPPPLQGKELEQALISITGYLRHRMGKELYLKRIPELHFHYDDLLEQGQNIDRLFNQIVEERQHGAGNG